MTTTINQPEKLRYSESRLSRVEQTATADYNVTVPVSRLREKFMRDQPAMTEGHHDMIRMIVEALEQTDVFQWVRSMMAQQAGTKGGGEVAVEAPSATFAPRQEKMYGAQMDPGTDPDPHEILLAANRKYQRARADSPTVMRYSECESVEQAAQSAAERHDAIEEARTELHECYARSCAATAGVSQRAVDLAVQRGCSFEEALTHLGSSMPTIFV